MENKIADKITSVGKSKNKQKKDESTEVEEIYIPPEKRQQNIDYFLGIISKWNTKRLKIY